jgi:D-threo-aldose 1-dehydrogenase
MASRRTFLTTASKGIAGAMLAPIVTSFDSPSESAGLSADDNPLLLPDTKPQPVAEHYRPPYKWGMGGVALGNAFMETDERQAYEAMQAAWDAGVRYYDTSPWYGLGISERRMGRFLRDKDKNEYIISTKVGRLLYPDASFKHEMWKGRLNFNYRYDYSADGARRSVEDSLQRLGIPSLDIVYIHDLSPDNKDLRKQWTEYFKTAQNGAMKELTKMREEGLIRGWGLGVNTIEPALRTLEVADLDIFLSATKYSLVYHKDDLNTLFPACEKRGVSIVVGAPLAAGLLAGKDRYLYDGKKPKEIMDRYDKLKKIAADHKVDLRTAALQFTAAPNVVASTIPGARSPQQVKENVASMTAVIPEAFWKELKHEKLVEQNAPEPIIWK